LNFSDKAAQIQGLNLAILNAKAKEGAIKKKLADIISLLDPQTASNTNEQI
jgi:hypothetical protein